MNTIVLGTATLFSLGAAQTFPLVETASSAEVIVVSQAGDQAAQLEQALADLAAAQSSLEEVTASGGDTTAASKAVAAAEEKVALARAALEDAQTAEQVGQSPADPDSDQTAGSNETASEQPSEERPNESSVPDGPTEQSSAPVDAQPQAELPESSRQDEQPTAAPAEQQERSEATTIDEARPQDDQVPPSADAPTDKTAEETSSPSEPELEAKLPESPPNAESGTEPGGSSEVPQITSESPAPDEDTTSNAENADATQNVGSEEKPETAETRVNAAEPVKEPAPIAEQIDNAGEAPLFVLPETITTDQAEDIRVAEEKRRSDARKRRGELLGAAAVGVAVGSLVPLLGGKLVGDEGDRVIVERNGEYFVRKDENALLRGDGVTVEIEELVGGRSRETMTRPNGVQIVTLRDPGGYVLKRTRVYPNGDETNLIDTREDQDAPFVDFDQTLPPITIGIDQRDYVVSVRERDRDAIERALLAPPVESVERAYSLREIRQSKRLRDKLRRLDLDTVTFDTGSATIRSSQIQNISEIANAIADVINRYPGSIFLIEGHTDAVGSEISNLTLSDRRAETVARILTEYYGLPPENFVVEGYGEYHLKVDTQGPERLNRRATIRNISPLLNASRG